MPKDTKTLGNNKARACESLGFVHKKRLCQRFDTTSCIIRLEIEIVNVYCPRLYVSIDNQICLFIFRFFNWIWRS